MKRVSLIASAAVLAAQGAFAGGIERGVPSLGFMFEEGNYAEFSTALIRPSVSGTFMGVSSGSVLPQYAQSAAALKVQLSDALSFGLVIDQPVGASVSYPGGTGYPFAGSTANVSGIEVRGILKYTMPNNISVIGGLRQQMVSGQVHLPAANAGAGYRMTTETSSVTGYMAGLAWEKPEIAARVALTYYSEMAHEFTVQEGTNAGTGPSLPFTSVVPESIRLDFQTGVAPGTLVFGSVHHQKWSKFDISPVGFGLATGSSLVDLTHDTTTYTLGVGRQLNDRLSASASVAYEKANGGVSGNLSPTDGRTTIGLGLRYKTDGNATISGGISYSFVGDAQTAIAAPPVPLSEFTNNSTIAVGLKVGFNF